MLFWHTVEKTEDPKKAGKGKRDMPESERMSWRAIPDITKLRVLEASVKTLVLILDGISRHDTHV